MKPRAHRLQAIAPTGVPQAVSAGAPVTAMQTTVMFATNSSPGVALTAKSTYLGPPVGRGS